MCILSTCVCESVLKVVQNSIQLAAVAAGCPLSLCVIGVCTIRLIVVFDTVITLIFISTKASVVVTPVSTVRVIVSKVMRYVIIVVSVAIAIIAAVVRMSIIITAPAVRGGVMAELLLESLNLPLQEVFE